MAQTIFDAMVAFRWPRSLVIAPTAQLRGINRGERVMIVTMLAYIYGLLSEHRIEAGEAALLAVAVLVQADANRKTEWRNTVRLLRGRLIDQAFKRESELAVEVPHLIGQFGIINLGREV